MDWQGGRRVRLQRGIVWVGGWLWLLLVIYQAIAQLDHSTTLPELEAYARSGDIRAAELLAEWFLAELNFSSAKTWFERAAKNGSANAQWRLGEILKNGTPAIEGISEEVSAEPTNALRSFFAAARQGHAQALFELGRCYEKGIGVPADPVEAYKWYKLGAEHGSLAAADSLAALEPELSPEDKAEAAARAGKFSAGRQTILSGVPAVPVLEQMVLRGISGPKGRRLALINNETFGEGEERELMINDRPILVKCLEISDHSVVLRIAGLAERKELVLSR